MAQPLENRVALVTGAGRGIGKSIAKQLVEAGAAVVVADNGTGIDGQGQSPEPATETANELGAAAAAWTDSVASPGAAAKAVAFAVDRFGGLDILVNNAAILRDAFIFKGDPADFEAVIRNNLGAAYYLANQASQVMRTQGKAGRGGDEGYNWGRIINIISTAGLYGNLGQTPYAASKAGLVGLTRVAAMDLARAGVTVNAVAPFAATRVTDMIRPANDAQAQYKSRALTLDAGHVARFIGYLASDQAARVSGQVFGVRGREIFLFSQPRPAARIEAPAGAWDAAALQPQFEAAFHAHLTDLTTDLEAFNTEPVV